ncbi:MAG: acyl-ACP--UDP-N-acetylglucosamine O-acyltransferase [Candidatus Hatepunaea meridiana]|nr:acyl-ACP--UDP-N-acetylglucosamine O-acyltransferase [Candidatus Hatepunaea meridiana]
MNNLIHKTAIIDPSAKIGNNVEICPYSIIEANTEIGDGCRIAYHALIAKGTKLGPKCQVFTSAVVGTIPQDLKFQDEESYLYVGEGTIIREFATLNRGTEEGGSITQVGNNCLLMAYSHVAHDCKLGNNVILANGVNMAGHVTIEDNVGISGLCVIHQFTRIGRFAYIGGGSRVPQDVPPFILTTGEPLKYLGLNVVGLKRKGFKLSQLSTIKAAYQFIYRSNLNLTQAVDAIKSELEQTEEIKEILDFIDKSDRGLIGR